METITAIPAQTVAPQPLPLDWRFLENPETMVLSERDTEILLAVLASDSEPNEALKRANEDRKRLIAS